MKYGEAAAMEKACFAQVINRLPVLLLKGSGAYVFDDENRRYLDFYSGVAVSSVGHAHPRVVETITEQSSKLMHASTWVYTEPQLTLADRLTKLTGMERVFYTNDGSGAVETAIKLARKHTGRKGIVPMRDGFHGRTMGALSATWSTRYRQPFEPLVPGFRFAEYNDLDSLRDSITGDTAAVIVEPIQGEGGIIVPDGEYLKGVRDLTSEKGVLLIVDEAQTGFGRTGSWFEYQRAGIKPDILVTAKGLGGGFPIGAVLYSGMDFGLGEHGGTFNGSPLACAVANTVIDIIEGERLVENAANLGRYIMGRLPGDRAHGRGLMVGVDVDDGRGKCLSLLEKGLIVIYSGNTLRLLPPLIIDKSNAKTAVELVTEVL